MGRNPSMKATSLYIPIEMHMKFKKKAEGYETNISQLMREFIQAFNEDRLTIRQSERTHAYRIVN